MVTMTFPLEFLIYRITEKGIAHNHIPGIVRNVLRIIGEGGLFTTRLVNEHLEQLGWGREVLDETSFELIVYILKSEWGYRVRHYSLGQMDINTGAQKDPWQIKGLGQSD